MSLVPLNVTTDSATSSIVLYNSSSITLWAGLNVMSRYSGATAAGVIIASGDNAKEKLVFVGSPAAPASAVGLFGSTQSGGVRPTLGLNVCVNSTGPTGQSPSPVPLPVGVSVTAPTVCFPIVLSAAILIPLVYVFCVEL